MVLSKYAVCNSRKSKFLKEQGARGLLSSLGIRTPLSQIPLLGPLLFQKYKKNEIISLGQLHLIHCQRNGRRLSRLCPTQLSPAASPITFSSTDALP